jgi:hypothetical protein
VGQLELPREELQPIVELVAHKAARQAQVREILGPYVNRVVHDERHALLREYACEALALAALGRPPAAHATCRIVEAFGGGVERGQR